MSHGDSRKDRPGFSSRRHFNSLDNPDHPRNSASYASVGQPTGYPPAMAVPNRPLFNYWHSPRHHQPGSHNMSPMHHFPGHQMFLQHRPFGSEGNQYRPVAYLPHFHIRYPPHMEHQHSSFLNNDSRHHSYGRRDPLYFEDQSVNRYEVQNGHDRRSYQEQGAIPKLSRGQYQKGKAKVFRKKKRNHNNSSDVSALEKERSLNSKASNCKENGEKYSGRSQPRSSKTSTETHSLQDSKHSNIEGNEPLYAASCGEDSWAVPVNHVSEIEESRKKSSADNELGAVGGDINHFNPGAVKFEDVPSSLESERLSGCSYDKNLIDEGAICDLDKMFQHQEFSHCNDDNSDDFQSDNDTRLNCDPSQDTKRLPVTRCNGELCKNLSGEESECENCSYVYNHHNHCLCDKSRSSSCLQGSGSGRQCTIEDRRNDEAEVRSMRSPVRANLSDDGEDTGDFIDTDLPSNNKHILSSSDEMENISLSSSSSDHEDDIKNKKYDNHKDLHGRNDLSSGESKFLNELESLHIGEHTEKCCDSLPSSQLRYHKYTDKENVLNDSLPVKGRTRKTSHSSGSECGDSSPSGSSPLLSTVHSNFKPHECYPSPCLDGAAASQLPQETHHKLRENNSCPPGAESALPSTSPTSCFQSNVFCSGAIYRPCQKNKPNQSPGREHFAFTASSVEPGDGYARPHKPDSASCSTTADGGACCPSGHQPSSVNDLNASCHHSHSHVANGFNEDSPGANFSNDESNRHQKVFVKFPVEDKQDEGESHSASSCDLEDVDVFSMSSRKQDKSSDSGGSEDPLSHDSGDNVDIVLLPMEEEIEPVHHMGPGFCAGGVDDSDDIYAELQGQQATSCGISGANLAHHLCEEHQYLCAHDHNPLRNGMPSKEFYDLIKTVSTTDSYMRFFDKDGHDVQRQPYVPYDDEESSSGNGQNSKTERLKVDRVMIWNEYEAYVMQFKQIAVSACGQTAVLNVLKALRISCEKLAVCKVIQTTMRKEDACIPEYLFSRAVAGTTAEELLTGVEKLSGGTVGGRFFPFWPPRKVKLLQWLAYWMKRGAIPVATLNLQQGPYSLWEVPDSWHHQMVYGVSHQGLYLTNPLEIVSERSAMNQLCSDSVLMVRRQDIISRFRETTDLGQLLKHPDPRWRTMNVLGQVVNVLREFNMPSVPGYRLQVTSHITIPAFYKAGITLFMRKDKPAWNSLLSAPEIPLEE